jgi:hypothetical protein
MENNFVTTYLRNCADQIEGGAASMELIENAIEFFFKGGANIEEKTRDELTRYIFMGWYVYQNIDAVKPKKE